MAERLSTDLAVAVRAAGRLPHDGLDVEFLRIVLCEATPSVERDSQKSKQVEWSASAFRMVRFVVSVDTEEDNWFPVSHGISAENLRELPRLARFFEGLGIRATYFATYQVAACAWATETLGDISSDGRAEIGAHLHPWNTPPMPSPPPRHRTMLSNYPTALQLAKMECLTETLEGALGVRPTSFRAGRFGLGPKTIGALAKCGYRVDSSVTPFISWHQFDNGPDFVGAPVEIYRPHTDDVRLATSNGPITEVPISVGYTRIPKKHWLRMARWSTSRLVRPTRLVGLAARLGLTRRVMLSPETDSPWDMLSLSQALIRCGAEHLHMFFHSSSLCPGLTPFTRTSADIARLYASIEEYLDALANITTITFATVEEAASAARLESPA